MVFAFPFRMLQTLTNMIYFLSLPLLTLSGSQPGFSSDSPAEPGDFLNHQLLQHRMQNMKKPLSSAAQIVPSPTARRAEQTQHWEDRRSQSRWVTHRICPHQFEKNNGGIDV